MSISSESRRVARSSSGLIHHYNLAWELACGLPEFPYPVGARTAVTCLWCVAIHARWLARCARGAWRVQGLPLA